MKKLQVGAIYAGGFIGPFTGQALAVVLPEFAGSFRITVTQAALTMSVYLFPFATMMLFSGRLVRRIPPHRVILTAYAVTLVLSLLLLFTPSWVLFLICFALIGIANAFTTPVLQNVLRELRPPEQLGSALGTYAAMQSLGMLSAPLVSGVSSLLNWRLTFLVTVATAAFILLVRVPVVPAPDVSPQKVVGRIHWGAVGIHMASSFVVGVGVIGLGFLTSLYVGERFDLAPVGRGVVVMCGGTAAFLAARRIGAMADRFGVRRVLVASALVGAVALVLLPVAPWVVAVALLWAVAVTAAQGIQATVNLAVIGGPGGSSLISTVQAFRFFGSAATPVLLLPVYTAIGPLTFWLPAAALVLVALAQQLGPGTAAAPRPR